MIKEKERYKGTEELLVFSTPLCALKCQPLFPRVFLSISLTSILDGCCLFPHHAFWLDVIWPLCRMGSLAGLGSATGWAAPTETGVEIWGKSQKYVIHHGSLGGDAIVIWKKLVGAEGWGRMGRERGAGLLKADSGSDDTWRNFWSLSPEFGAKIRGLIL